MASTLWQLLAAFFRVGVLGYGGGPPSIPLVKAEAVDRYGWLSEEEFVDVLAMGNALPGPIATKMAAYVGYKAAGFAGSTVAVLAMIGPTWLAMIGLFTLLAAVKNQPVVEGMIRAVRPVVIVLLVQLVVDLFPNSVAGPATWGVMAVAAVLLLWLKVHPALVVALSLVFGAVALR